MIIGVAEDSKGTGELEATGGAYAAGIGGGYNESVSNIKITGGNITATGKNCGAGIGGGFGESGSNIIISGGTITAKGGRSSNGFGAGIGSGYGDGTGSGNSISGDNIVVIAESGDATNTTGTAAGIGTNP